MEEVKKIQYTDQYELDDESLLHPVSWRKGETYYSIANFNSDFNLETCGKAFIVFDE